jgi:hypothetical protein
MEYCSYNDANVFNESIDTRTTDKVISEEKKKILGVTVNG